MRQLNNRFSIYVLSLFWVGMFSLILSSCNQDEVKPEVCKDGKCDFEIMTDSEIFILEDSAITEFDIVNGDNLVFQYQYQSNDNKRIADDEYLERIFFEIHADSSSFSFSDAELIDLNAVFQRSCFCPGPFWVRIESGLITGTKQDDGEWKIDADLSIEIDGNTIERDFSKTFKDE